MGPGVMARVIGGSSSMRTRPRSRVPSGGAISSSASASSAADAIGGRLARSSPRTARVSASRFRGTPARTWRGEHVRPSLVRGAVGSPHSRFSGHRPVSAEYSRPPIARTSSVARSAESAHGSAWLWAPFSSAATTEPVPRSTTLTMPCPEMMTSLGRRSPWWMPRSCAAASTRATASITVAAWSGRSGPSADSVCRETPSTHSLTT